MLTYKDAGVDIEAGEKVVDQIKPLVRQTFTEDVLTDIGAFGGFFSLASQKFDEPVLVSSVDGVGTKIIVAIKAGIFDTVGQDLVNHCVNDIAVCGAKPLFFLDYFSTGKLDETKAVQIIKGFATACKENGCALIGGETAEMPDLYKEGDFDLAGTVVGIVDRENIIDGKGIEAGDVMIGLPSTGLHTNGYSLARKALFAQYDVSDRPEELGGESIGEALLAVHKSYLREIQHLAEAGIVKGLAHITGGGMEGNTSRIIPDGFEAIFNWGSWPELAIFDLIRQKGEVPEVDMRKSFNLGIGLVAVVDPGDVIRAQELLADLGSAHHIVGQVALD